MVTHPLLDHTAGTAAEDFKSPNQVRISPAPTTFSLSLPHLPLSLPLAPPEPVVGGAPESLLQLRASAGQCEKLWSAGCSSRIPLVGWSSWVSHPCHCPQLSWTPCIATLHSPSWSGDGAVGIAVGAGAFL